jgi:hypothetical protein
MVVIAFVMATQDSAYAAARFKRPAGSGSLAGWTTALFKKLCRSRSRQRETMLDAGLDQAGAKPVFKR